MARPSDPDGGRGLHGILSAAPVETNDQRHARDQVRELRISTGVVAAATSMIALYSLLTPDGPNRGALLAVLLAALTIHVSMIVFGGPRLARLSRQGWGGLGFLLLCFGFVTAWVALDGGSPSPVNTAYVIPLTVAVLRAPSASQLLAGLAIGSHVAATLVAEAWFAGTFEPAVSLVWTTQFVLTTVVTAWIAQARIAQRRRLQALTHELEDLAIRDPLTQVLNRRGFETTLWELATEPGSGPPSALIVADLDHFKRINDAHGHATGDDVLVAAARAIRDAVRAVDVVARTGGEEFAIALFDADDGEAVRVAHRVRAAVASCGVEPPVTVSLGVALTTDLDPSTTGASPPLGGQLQAASSSGGSVLERLHLAADRALYRAKDLGRDRVEVADPVVDARGPATGAPAPNDGSRSPAGT